MIKKVCKIFLLLIVSYFVLGNEYCFASRNVREDAFELMRIKVEKLSEELDKFIKEKSSYSLDDFAEDNDFVDIAFRSIGKNGYSFIADPATKEHIIHPNRDLVGVDLGYLGDDLTEWWELYTELLEKEGCGSYYWKEDDGSLKEKYMCSKKLNEKIDGKSLVLFSTAYLDEIAEVALQETSNLEGMNFETKGLRVASEFTKLLDETVEDGLELIQIINEKGIEENAIKVFAENKRREIWYNLGSDINPIEQRKKLPLYREISVIDKNGNEILKYSNGVFSNDLKNVSIPENTDFKNETYFQDARETENGHFYIGKLMTWYITKDEVFEGAGEEDFNKYNKLIGRDIMKDGVIRFSSPIYRNNEFDGVVVLSLDYRHIQEIAKHIDPTGKDLVSTSYEGNYLLVYDVDGNTIVHPKPDNIRGYLPDGYLAGLNDGKSDREGSIFNLFEYHKSDSYNKMAETTLEEKAVYTSSATDVSGRTKMTVAIPIEYNNERTNYKDIGVWGGIMMSVELEKDKEETYQELSVKLKALETADQISKYLELNPEMKLSDLQNDNDFKKIAIQKVGDSGYTAVVDSRSGLFYFHPQEKLVGKDPHDLASELPDWWAILNKTIGETCSESSGSYDWLEEDGETTKKYMYLSCVKNATADGKNLVVAATSYLDDSNATIYLDRYKIDKKFSFAKDSIRQKAKDVAKQIEIYLKAYPEKTVTDLQSDEVFKEIAVQQVGETGYTAVTDYNSLIARFHANPDIVDLDLSKLSEKLPGFWSIMSKTRGGHEADGIYNWQEADGTIRQKYMYIALVDAKTADGVGLHVAATTYLDEYEKATVFPGLEIKEEQVNYRLYIQLFIVLLLVFCSVVFILYYFKIIRFERIALMVMMGSILLMIGGFFVFISYTTVNNLKTQFLKGYVDQHYQLEKLESDYFIGLLNDLENELSYIASEIGKSESNTSSLLEGAYTRMSDYVYASYRINERDIVKSMYPVDENSLGADIGEQEYMIETRETLKPVISDVFDTAEGFKGVIMYVPILKNGRYDGAVAYLINIDNFVKSIDLFKDHNHSYESFLVDEKANIIASDIEDNIGKDIMGLHTDKKVQEIYEDIIDRKEPGYRQVIENGKNQIVVYKPFNYKNKTWYMLITGFEEQAYRGIDNTLKKVWMNTLATLFMLIVFGSLIVYYITRSLRREVELKTKELSIKAKQISEQLEKEEAANKVKEELIREQKEAKKALVGKVDELERFQKLTVDRELKMIELKEEIKKLKKNK